MRKLGPGLAAEHHVGGLRLFQVGLTLKPNSMTSIFVGKSLDIVYLVSKAQRGWNGISGKKGIFHRQKVSASVYFEGEHSEWT